MSASPAPAELAAALRAPLEATLGARLGRFSIALVGTNPAVADGTTVLRLAADDGRPLAVALCSAPLAPRMIARSMSASREARAVLDAPSRERILEPLAEGDVAGLSYAVLPWCDPLAASALLWRLQRARLRAPLFDWLWQVARASHHAPAALEPAFIEPLRAVAACDALDAGLRSRAAQAAARAGRGWAPRHVLMHSDLWKGNILLRRPAPAARGWGGRWVVIDWAGARLDGHAFFDLVRLAHSVRLPPRRLAHEVARHCALLGSGPDDARAALLAALGHVLLNLGEFQIERYASMAHTCATTLEQALPPY